MKKNIVLTVRQLIEGVIEQNGYVLWDVEYQKEGTSYNLTVTIDKDGEVDIDDCVKVNGLIDPILDKADPIEDSYYLEVSSAGLERELKYESHFKKFIGSEVEIKLFAPIDGKKSFKATLTGFEDGILKLCLDGKETELEQKKCALVKNYVDYAKLMKDKE